MECYQNEKKTIFNDKYPIGNILQEWVYDTLFVLSVKVDDPKEKKDQCQSITFKPIQVDDPSQNICKKRSIHPILRMKESGGNIVDSVDKSDIDFDDDVSASGGPPELDIPDSSESITVRLVTHKDMNSTRVLVW